jgi:hypothetical protein
MKAPSSGALSFGLIGLTAITLLAIGTPNSRGVPLPGGPVGPLPPTVSAGGFSLASASVDLPTDETGYPDGPHVDVINANCTSCHSASMALTQPPLSPDQWKAEVTKMREVYKAPVAETDVPAIVAYLTGMSSKLPNAPKGVAKGGGSKAAAETSDGSG